MCFYTKFKTFLMHKDLNVKPNDYIITVLDRRGSSQMITVDYIGGGGSKKKQKNDSVILEQLLMTMT